MYINFPLLQTKGLIPSDVIVLQAISQNRNEDHSGMLENIADRLDFYEQQGFVDYVKAKRKADTKFMLVRLTEKGSKILEEIQIPAVNDDDLGVYSWLEKKYKDSGKDIGNAKKTKSHIAQFRVNSGIERNHLVFLCKVFMNDEHEMEYSKRLEFLFFKPANAFSVKFDIEQSRLYQYYLKRKEQFDAKFATIEN